MTLLIFFSALIIPHKTSKIFYVFLYLCYDYKYVHHDIFSFITDFLVNKSSFEKAQLGTLLVQKKPSRNVPHCVSREFGGHMVTS